MQLSNSQQSVLLLFVIMLFSSLSIAQSKMEYGIGIGLLYGDYHESNNLPVGYEFDIDEARFSPSVNLYMAYSITDKVKITASPGFNFHLHNEPFSTRDLSAIHLHLPIGMQYQIIGNLSVMGDLYYDYLVNQSYEFRGEHGSITDMADTRNLYGASAGLAYSVGQYMEIQLTASHQFNTVNSFPLTDQNGVELGDVKLKNRFLKLNLVFRG